MDVEKRFELVSSVGEEIVTREELKGLLQTKSHPVAYDGFEPSGLAPVHFGVYRALNLKTLLKAGIRFKLLLADWHGWINNKMGGDLGAIQKVGEYFVEVWRAAGVDLGRVEVVWASELVKDPEYWRKVILVAKNATVARATRCLTIMGRKEGELQDVAQYFYPMMQVADIFHLGVDICQLGLDQRRANILAREIAPKFRWKKPVLVHHHMLMGLQGVKRPDGFEADRAMDLEISSKMSKSRPESAIFVHDQEEDIRRKMNGAYCPAKDTENNPVLEFCRYMIMRGFKEFEVQRPKKFGGPVAFHSYEELEGVFREGKLHPQDLKAATASYMEKMVHPIREHFETNKKARELYDFVRKREVTR
jgi:tyrosyl-tRNA synthetase